MNNILVYGANGYTGRLISRFLIDQGYPIIIAGRNDKVNTVARELKCPARVFTVEDASSHLHDIDILVNAAGPFNLTQIPLVKACLKSKTHYLDLAGEYREMEAIANYDELAKQAGICVLAGAGFGVVPTDLAANHVAKQIDNPEKLIIAYATKGGVSRGTLHTVLRDIHHPGIQLKDGIYSPQKPAVGEITFQISNQIIRAVSNPWRADLITAHKSTEIPTVQTFSEFPGIVVQMMKGKHQWLRKFLQKIIRFLPEGPSANQLKQGKTFIWAQASNKRETAEVSIVGPEAYVFTARSVEACILCLTTSQKAIYGVVTPAALDIKLSSIEGVTIS